MKVYAEFPAYKIIMPAVDTPDLSGLLGCSLFAIAYQSKNHGELFDIVSVNTLKNYCESTNTDYDDSRMLGEKEAWIIKQAVCLTEGKREQEVKILLKIDQVVFIDGKQYKIATAPNHNYELIEV